MKGRTWDSLAAPNFVKIAQEDSYLWGKLLSKIRFFFAFFAILSYLSPHFCTYNIEILLKRTESLQDTNRSSDSAHGLPVLHCLGRDAF